jgi:hypothetical protein
MKVLYILGGSRTGSTIVDNLLNEVDGFSRFLDEAERDLPFVDERP